jgi:hypothetical protein
MLRLFSTWHHVENGSYPHALFDTQCNTLTPGGDIPETIFQYGGFHGRTEHVESWWPMPVEEIRHGNLYQRLWNQ